MVIVVVQLYKFGKNCKNHKNYCTYYNSKRIILLTMGEFYDL